MGFLKKIVKGVKNIFKGVGKVVKKAWKGVKKFASSKIGKLALVGATIYFGGAALGAWGGGSGAAAGTAGQLASSTIPATTGTVGGATVSTTLPQAAIAGSGAGVGAGAGAASSGGLLSAVGGAAKSALTYAQNNPALTIAGGQLVSALSTPSAAEEYEEMEKARRRGSNIAGVGYGGEGQRIDLGLVRRTQRDDLQKSTVQQNRARPQYQSTVPTSVGG